MSKKLKFHKRILSIIIGLISGIYFGWLLNVALNNYYNPPSFIFWIVLPFVSILLGLSAFKFPRTTEVLIAGFIISFILIGGLWDLLINDFSMLRAKIILGGIIILTMDILIGSVTIFELKKVGKRLFGVN